MGNEELVAVFVPKRHLSKVYGYIAALDTAAGVAPPPRGGSDEDEWNEALLRRMVNESSPALLQILSAIADRPVQWQSTHDLALAIGLPGVTWNTISGTLGAFNRRIKGRYKLQAWPFEVRVDVGEKGARLTQCRMTKERAAVIMRLISDRE